MCDFVCFLDCAHRPPLCERSDTARRSGRIELVLHAKSKDALHGYRQCRGSRTEPIERPVRDLADTLGRGPRVPHRDIGAASYFY